MKQRSHLKEMMRHDLMKVYRDVCGSYECETNKEAFERVVVHPAPRYYVDPRWAHQVISPMMRGDRSRLERMSPLMREMYEELFGTVLRLAQMERYWGRSLHYILRFAVAEPAPRFYISAARMAQIWRRSRREQQKKSMVRI